MFNYFSDKYENTSETISIDVWNGIVAQYDELVSNNILAKHFPENCYDGQGIVGVNKISLEDAIKSEIPEMSIPIRRSRPTSASSWDSSIEENGVSLYNTLDFIEFLFRHLCSPKPIGKIHDHFSHYHLSFDEDISQQQEDFISKINTIFHRNKLPYLLQEDGLITRINDETMAYLVMRDEFYTPDKDLNQLLNIAYSKFKSPKKEMRKEALEKLWDAYERMKTIYAIDPSTDKKGSIATLLKTISDESEAIVTCLDKDMQDLTDTGNGMHIRHYETDKVPITNDKHVDYLFFRMSNIIQLCLKSLEVKI
jgi:hypothetical protein